VIPVFSSAALATNSEATKIVAGSPKPAKLWFSVSTPVTQSASAQPTQTATTGSRSQMNKTMTPAMVANTIQMSVMLTSAGCILGRRRHHAPSSTAADGFILSLNHARLAASMTRDGGACPSPGLPLQSPHRQGCPVRPGLRRGAACPGALELIWVMPA
jgi:hypothetical protein